MSSLYDEIKSVLEANKRPFSWLAEQVGYSRQGLKTSLINGNIKYDTLIKIANLLEINVSRFFYMEPTKDVDSQVHYLRYQAKQEKRYIDELEKENEILKERIEALKKEIETYQKFVDVLHKKIDHSE